jgi:hypothetical protein
MKGLLFGGCSFTWGQGLYFYSDLNKLKYPINEYTYRKQDLTNAHMRFKDTIRYPRLVANHFNTFEIFKNENGGSEDETFDFFDTLFTKDDNHRNSHLTNERHDYDDVEYIIIQLSQIHRNKFHFILDGKHEFDAPSFNDRKLVGYNTDKLLRYFDENNIEYTEYERLHKEYQFGRLKSRLQQYESRGIKTKIMCWEQDLISEIIGDVYMNERLITLDYNGVEYKTIRELHDNNPHLKIKGDKDFFGDNLPDDHHPSLECHKILASNVIKSIEKDLNK